MQERKGEQAGLSGGRTRGDSLRPCLATRSPACGLSLPIREDLAMLLRMVADESFFPSPFGRIQSAHPRTMPS